MLRSARSVGLAVATLTPLAALAIGDASQQYDDSNKVVYAKQQLLQWRGASENKANTDKAKRGEPTATAASAWLGSAPPKFPYLLSISSGDNPEVVTNTYVASFLVTRMLVASLTRSFSVRVHRLLDGAPVLGSYDEPTRETLEKLTAPTSALALAVHRIAMRYSGLKAALHGEVPAAFDPRVGLKVTAEDTMLDALLDALRDLQYSEQLGEGADERDAGLSASSQNTQEAHLPVFLLRDFDALSDQDAERWMRWTHQVSSEGLAHVVLLTTSAVTPAKVQWLQARHQSGRSAAAADPIQDFVAILLRPANGLVDTSSAEDKLREIAVRAVLALP
jgi:hypothetical protein